MAPPVEIGGVAAIAAPGVVAGALALMFIMYLQGKIGKQRVGKDIGKPQLDKLAGQVRRGSIAFLKIEYQYLAAFVTFLAIVVLILFSVQPIDKKKLEALDKVYDGNYDDGTDGVRVAAALIVGAILSGSAGWFGMSVATLGNVRTTVACTEGTLNDGLQTAFTSGSVMGFTVVGLGLMGLSLMFWIMHVGRTVSYSMEIMAGFGVGGSSIALFARVAGGIYTKAADVGADLVGKVEAGIDEDDPHNPAVIADNVGDNVGDVAGMGADLFESYVGSIIAACTLAPEVAMVSCKDGTSYDAANQFVAFPFILSAVGIVCSLIGTFFVKTSQEGKGWNVKLADLMWGLERGMYMAAFLFVGLAALVVHLLFGDDDEGKMSADGMNMMKLSTIGWRLYGCVIIGLISGAMIGKITEYFTSFDYGPVISIKDRGRTGPATVVIQGIGVGMISCAPPTFILVSCILACSALGGDAFGNYAVAMAAVGMLATLGITLATDAYGPVADNAGGLAEMAGLGEDVRNKTDSLDALGNTTAATGKGFAIGSAVLTALSLLAAFKEKVTKLNPGDTNKLLAEGGFDISDSAVMAGCLFGAMLPYIFAAMTMISVGKAAAEIIEEVRRQFREIPGLRKAIERASAGETIPEAEDVEPDSDRCVEISTRSSVKEMIAPGLYAILAPIFVGFTVGPRCLMGMLAGSITSGAMCAIMMSNAGGAWDNSKKLCEKLDIKKTDQGKACIMGDTVGDPFKDTSGPALNILIKLMSMVSLLIAPLLRNQEDWSQWYFGMIAVGLFIIVTFILVQKQVLTWKDPLLVAQQAASGQKASSVAPVPVPESKPAPAAAAAELPPVAAPAAASS